MARSRLVTIAGAVAALAALAGCPHAPPETGGVCADVGADRLLPPCGKQAIDGDAIYYIERYGYDDAGHLITVTHDEGPNLDRTESTYDEHGNLTSENQSRNGQPTRSRTWVWTYDAAGRAIAVDASEGGTLVSHETRTYDAAGRWDGFERRFSDTDRVEGHFTYDAEGRQIERRELHHDPAAADAARAAGLGVDGDVVGTHVVTTTYTAGRVAIDDQERFVDDHILCGGLYWRTIAFVETTDHDGDRKLHAAGRRSDTSCDDERTERWTTDYDASGAALETVTDRWDDAPIADTVPPNNTVTELACNDEHGNADRVEVTVRRPGVPNGNTSWTLQYDYTCWTAP